MQHGPHPTASCLSPALLTSGIYTVLLFQASLQFPVPANSRLLHGHPIPNNASEKRKAHLKSRPNLSPIYTNSFFFCGIRDGSLGLPTGLHPQPSLLFSDSASLNCPGWALTCDLSASASQSPGVRGLCQHAWLRHLYKLYTIYPIISHSILRLVASS